MAELVLNAIIYIWLCPFCIDPQVAEEKRFLKLCYDGTADISDFSSLLAQGVGLNIYNQVGATAWQ